MLDHRGAALARNRLRFSDQTCNVNSNHGSAGDGEFDFWGARNMCHSQFTDELQCQESMWKSRNSAEYELSPLLPYNYQCSNLSNRTRSEAIAEGRRELMEMIQSMPECNYELSLKDIVDEEEKKTSEEVKKEEMVVDERSSGFETEDSGKKKQKKKTKMKTKNVVDSGGISRTASMDNKVFLIKMFFPRSLGSRKKETSKNCSRVSPRASFERSQNDQGKEQWIKRITVERGNEASGKNCSKNNNTSRKVEVISPPGCWSIFHTKKSKSKSKGQRGCIF